MSALDLERIAIEAGGRLEAFMSNPPKPLAWHFKPEELRRFTALVAEECAKVCDVNGNGPASDFCSGCRRGSIDCAAAIRAKFKDHA